MSPKGGKTNVTQISQVKSPLDTTIYVPALTQRVKKLARGMISIEKNFAGDNELSGQDRNCIVNGSNVFSPKFDDSQVVSSPNGESNQNTFKQQVMDKISDFVDSMRKELENTSEDDLDTAPRPRLQVVVPAHNIAKEKTENSIIEAEKFRASVAEPPGKEILVI